MSYDIRFLKYDDIGGNEVFRCHLCRSEGLCEDLVRHCDCNEPEFWAAHKNYIEAASNQLALFVEEF